MRCAGLGRIVLGVAGVLVTGTAAAQQRATLDDLSWQAPAGCPQADEVRERIRALTGSPTQRESRLRAEGEITREENHFHLRLVVHYGDLVGERNIVSDSCEDLAGAAAVAIGLVLRSEVPLTEREARGNATPGTPAAGEPAPPEPSATEKRAPAGSLSARHWQALLRAPVIVTDFGPLPQPSLGLALGTGISYEQWRFHLLGELWLDQTVHGIDLPTFGADVSRETATLVVGRGFRLSSFELAPCLTIALEHIKARGVGPNVVPSDQSASWINVGPSVLGSMHLGTAVAVVAEIGGRFETSRPLIAIDGLGNLRQLGPFAFTTAIGTEWSF
jgi:hypothetical protein